MTTSSSLIQALDCGFEAEEAVQVWDEAQEKLFHLSAAQWGGEIFGDNVGVSMLLSDAASRAEELRKRAEERARETSAEQPTLPPGPGLSCSRPFSQNPFERLRLSVEARTNPTVEQQP